MPVSLEDEKRALLAKENGGAAPDTIYSNNYSAGMGEPGGERASIFYDGELEKDPRQALYLDKYRF